MVRLLGLAVRSEKTFRDIGSNLGLYIHITYNKSKKNMCNLESSNIFNIGNSLDVLGDTGLTLL